MSHSSTTDGKPGLWLTLLQALEYIRDTKKCGPVEAQCQLKRATGEGTVPVKWADASGPTAELDEDDLTYLQGSQLVLRPPGFALDSGSSRLRPLSVLKAALIDAFSHGSQKTTTTSDEIEEPKYDLARAKAEEKRVRWMTLVQAVEHVQLLENCDSVEALRQLKIEIGDGLVHLEWADSTKLSYSPDAQYLKTSQLLLIGVGLAPDSIDELYRPLSVERSATASAA